MINPQDKPETKPALAASAGSAGVSREMVMLAAGFCIGLSKTDRHDFDGHERKILRAAGIALRAAGEKLYDAHERTTAER